MFLETRNLTIGYAGKVVQTGLNLQADKSLLISLIGTNGTGKSTLLRTLALLQPELSGEIIVDGVSLKSIPMSERAKKISVVLTDTIVSEHLTVYDLVSMGRMPYTSWIGRLNAEDDKIVSEAIDNVNLTQKKFSLINELSDGERQRATIARALAQDTPLILLDEPTSHLDMPNRVEIMLLLKRLAEEFHKTIIISTHELGLALSASHKIWLLTKNDSVITATPKQIIENKHFNDAFSSPHFNPSNLQLDL